MEETNWCIQWSNFLELDPQIISSPPHAETPPTVMTLVKTQAQLLRKRC